MEEKKEIKISLGTLICICIIILLVVALIIVCFENIRLREKENDINTSNVEDRINSYNKSNEINDVNNVVITTSNETIDKNSNIDKLAQDETYFVIENIEKNGDKYEVTANILEKTKKTLSQEEYNKIVNGEKFTFRGLEWQKNETQNTNEILTIKSGKYILSIVYDNEEKNYYLENVAGAVSGGLSDYSGETARFEINNIDETILNEYSNSKDEYSECSAKVSNGEVIDITFVIAEYR